MKIKPLKPFMIVGEMLLILFAIFLFGIIFMVVDFEQDLDDSFYFLKEY